MLYFVYILQEVKKRVAEQVKTFKEKMQDDLKKKDEQINSLKDELEKYKENENTLIINYQNEIQQLKEELELERRSAQEGLSKVSNMNKDQEEIFSAAIAEIEGYMNQLSIAKDKTNINNRKISQGANEKEVNDEESDEEEGGEEEVSKKKVNKRRAKCFVLTFKIIKKF